MKRTFRILLALALAAVFTLSLASCSLFTEKPELDLDDAKDALEDEKYTVTIVEDEDLLSVGIEATLSAMDAKSENSLRIVCFEDKKMAKLYHKQLKLEHETEIEKLELEIEALEYMLKEYEDDLDNEELDEYEDQLDELQEELDEQKEEYSFGIDGATVWSGTKEAVEDSKK